MKNRSYTYWGVPIPRDFTYYVMFYRCSNCHEQYIQDVPKGSGALGNGGRCPKCGVKDNGTFSYRDNCHAEWRNYPLTTTQVVRT